MLRKIVDLFTSLKLTIVCLAAGMALIFAGTLAQVHLGIHLTHAGLIIMLAGGLFTDLFAVESHMRLERGDTKNYSEDQRHMELAVIDTTDNDLDQVTAIPESVLRTGRTIDHWSLPFRIAVRNYYPNSRLQTLNQARPGA